jgi:alkylated DNA nucleotide flippase Atl1
LLARSEGLPWWRVVGSGGRIRTPVEAGQARRLADEGVLIVHGRVAAFGSD